MLAAGDVPPRDGRREAFERTLRVSGLPQGVSEGVQGPQRRRPRARGTPVGAPPATGRRAGDRAAHVRSRPGRARGGHPGARHLRVRGRRLGSSPRAPRRARGAAARRRAPDRALGRGAAACRAPRRPLRPCLVMARGGPRPHGRPARGGAAHEPGHGRLRGAADPRLPRARPPRPPQLGLGAHQRAGRPLPGRARPGGTRARGDARGAKRGRAHGAHERLRMVGPRPRRRRASLARRARARGAPRLRPRAPGPLRARARRRGARDGGRSLGRGGRVDRSAARRCHRLQRLRDRLHGRPGREPAHPHRVRLARRSPSTSSAARCATTRRSRRPS